MRYVLIIALVVSFSIGVGLACGDEGKEEATPTKIARPTFARQGSPTGAPRATQTPEMTATPGQDTPTPTWTPDTLPAIRLYV